MKKAILIAITIIGWITIAFRLYLRITEYDFSAFESTVQFFSYFTILTNLFVIIYCTNQLLKSKEKNTSLLNKPETLTALNVFILIVALVYHIVLKPLWNPEGIQMIVSEICHTVIPLGTLILWIISKNKGQVKLKSLLQWLLYPLIYIVFVLIRGSFSNFYPYPFLDVQTLGIEKVLINSLFLLIVMLIFLLTFFFIGKKLSRKTVANNV